MKISDTATLYGLFRAEDAIDEILDNKALIPTFEEARMLVQLRRELRERVAQVTCSGEGPGVE